MHDNPALVAASDECERIVPLFVLDEQILKTFGAPNRVAFLLEALRDLGGALEGLGGELAIRRGEVVEEVVRCARDVDADSVVLA